MERKWQIFISSTYIDMKDERQAVVEAVLRMGHIPAGMELFAAGDKSQVEVINQWIDGSDVYILILGGRYGSIDPGSGKSYIHLEYERAVEKGIPLFSLIISDEYLSKKRSVGMDAIESDNPDKYVEFKDFVKSKMCKICNDIKDIHIAVMQSLHVLHGNSRIIGWVSGSVLYEIDKLTEDLSIARKELEGKELLIRGMQDARQLLFNGLSYPDLKGALYSVSIDVPGDIGMQSFSGKKILKTNLLNLLLTYSAAYTAGISENASHVAHWLFIQGMHFVKYGLMEVVSISPVSVVKSVRLSNAGNRFLIEIEKERIAKQKIKGEKITFMQREGN